jgi:divalent metal cation (Fe/Co/Zn/Cd) transporter
VKEFLESMLDPVQVLEVRSITIEDHITIFIKIVMPADMSLTESHGRAEDIKQKILIQFPPVARVVIDVEPCGSILDRVSE